MTAKAKSNEHQAALASIAGLKDHPDLLPKNFIGDAGDGTCSVAVPSQLTINSSLEEILVFARNQEASDVHITVNNPIIFRKYTALIPQTKETLTKERIEDIIRKGLPAETVTQFLESGDLEFVHVIKGAGRFRVTLMK